MFGGSPQVCAEQSREFRDAGHVMKCSARARPRIFPAWLGGAPLGVKFSYSDRDLPRASCRMGQGLPAFSSQRGRFFSMRPPALWLCEPRCRAEEQLVL